MTVRVARLDEERGATKVDSRGDHGRHGVLPRAGQRRAFPRERELWVGKGEPDGPADELCREPSGLETSKTTRARPCSSTGPSTSGGPQASRAVCQRRAPTRRPLPPLYGHGAAVADVSSGVFVRDQPASCSSVSGAESARLPTTRCACAASSCSRGRCTNDSGATTWGSNGSCRRVPRWAARSTRRACTRRRASSSGATASASATAAEYPSRGSSAMSTVTPVTREPCDERRPGRPQSRGRVGPGQPPQRRQSVADDAAHSLVESFAAPVGGPASTGAATSSRVAVSFTGRRTHGPRSARRWLRGAATSRTDRWRRRSPGGVPPDRPARAACRGGS